MATTAELPFPVAYVATDTRPPYERIYGVGETRPGGSLWGVFQDSHGDFADLAGPNGERLPAEAGEGWKP